MSFQGQVNRRQAIGILGITGATLFLAPLSGCSRALKNLATDSHQEPENWFALNSPIDRTIKTFPRFALTGDEPHRAHAALWNKEEFLAKHGLPEPSEHVKVAVVGGGMSGLMSAYLLRDHNPVVFEVAPRFGGNSRGESWNGIDYSIGAAYFMEQTPGTPINDLFKEVGVFEDARPKKDSDPVAFGGKLYTDFWSGQTDPAAAQQFKKIAAYFEAAYQGKIPCPDVPALTEESREILNDLDKESFGAHLRRLFGELHPQIAMLLEYYNWSTLGASLNEVSAGVGLSTYASEFGGAYVMPGGNAAIAEKFLRKLVDAGSERNLRANSLVVDVRVEAGGTRVTWVDGSGNLKALWADVVVMACPKFVVKHVLHEIEPERKEAIERIQYRSYLVGNVLLEGEVPENLYDIFLLDKKLPDKVGFKATDAVIGTYARPRKDRTVLTLYRSLPFPASRARMLASGDYSDFHREFEAQIKNEILPLFHKTEADIRGFRVNRWGHPIPVALTGHMRDRTPEIIQAPFRERVFFVEQDNWMAPAIETCAIEALRWTPKVKALLASV